MPTPSANQLSSQQWLARQHRASRWLALSASGLLLGAAIVLADDEARPTTSPADTAPQASPEDAGQQAWNERPGPQRQPISPSEQARPKAKLERVQEASQQTQAQVATLQSQLTAVEAEKARLSLQLDLLNRKQADLEAQARELERVQQQLRHSQTAAERAEIEAAALRTEIQQLRQQRELATQKHTAQPTAAELRLREHKDRLGGVDARIQSLEQQLAQREAQIARLEAADTRRAEAKQQLEDRIAELRARLPAPEGGTLAAAQAQTQARRDAEVLARLIREGQGVQNPQLWQQIQETENALHRSQYLLARAQGDRTVYRVRPGDSLARISAMFYGDEETWTRLFEANRHLLDDPAPIPLGLTLVIP
ncbi:MAG: LysM peptidoglycan-binding domain-containing protein [Chromatiaceae bacterium]|nr:LysM peptidoglycan-binding domain-containing protein [Chromatiaceae bacterium]